MSPLRALPCTALALLLGCAGPEPVLYPNAQLTRVGKPQAENDIAQCRLMADEAGAHHDPDRVTQAAATTGKGALIGGAAGAVGGAISGSPGVGAAIGAASGATAGLLSSLFSGPAVSQVHRAFVDRCLRERGYEPMGWE